MHAPGFRLPAAWPRPADPGAAQRLTERFAELGRTEARLAKRPAVAALLACLGGNSPYLADLAIRDSATLRRLAATGPDAVVSRALAELADTPPAAPRKRIMAAMREAKRQVALATAIADIGGIWRLERITGALSDLAEATLRLATTHLLRAAWAEGALRIPDPAGTLEGCGLTVLGMGKLGARELNYSSDIDLVLLFDPGAGVYTDIAEVEALAGIYARIARNLVAMMETRDADGYVFRTDLRLRPDPAATPPAVALPAAIAYYESMGQNWERAAMTKARPLAGDLALGEDFLDAIRPFVWRRHLDFAAIADIHAMKRRIDAHTGGQLPPSGTALARVAGHNLKLGEGGIREIEFLAQTLQLVWGGRDPSLREPTTLGALRALVRAGHLPRRAAADLAADYRFLRRAEHRLQMVADRQTHDLPEKPAELERFALFMGFTDGEHLAGETLRHLNRAHARYAELFVAVPRPPDAATAIAAELDFSGGGAPDARTVAALARLGLSDPPRVVAAVRGWQSGRIRALRSQRSRELMAEMLPQILIALSGQPQPMAAFTRFDVFLASLPAGVQLLSLFQRNPGLLDRVAAVLGAAPQLADYLAAHPRALDGLLAPEDAPPPARLLRARLGDARSLDDAITTVLLTEREEEFALSVATMEGRLDADAAGLRRSAMADAALAELRAAVLKDFASRHGRVRGGAMAIVLLGKAGGRAMMAGSDLDLMLVYDHPEDVHESSRGANGRRLPASQWFVRAAHAVVAAVTAPGVDGPLYPVDMRLRPSGNKGPVAVSLAAFQRYHAQDAWTWERMALTRARVVAGPPALRALVADAIASALDDAGQAARIRENARAMRARLLRDLPPSCGWDVKLRAGGQIEVEFIAQVLQLIHGQGHPELRSPTTRIALERLAAAGHLSRPDASLLIRADRIWRTVQGMLRITLGRSVPDPLPEASARPLLRAAAAAGAPAVDLAGLRATLETLAQDVRAAFVRSVGEIA